MSLTKDHSFFPVPEPRCVFLTEIQLKGNLAFCWWGAGLDWEEQVTPVRCYWGESDAVARVWDRVPDHSFIPLTDTTASQTTKYSDMLEEGQVAEISSAGMGCELEQSRDCSGALLAFW